MAGVILVKNEWGHVESHPLNFPPTASSFALHSIPATLKNNYYHAIRTLKPKIWKRID